MSIEALTIPATYARLIVELAQGRGVDLGPTASGLFDSATLNDPQGRLKLLAVGQLLYEAYQQDKAIGYEIGLNTQFTSHGFVGYGVLTYPTLGEALDFGMRFATLRTPFVSMSRHQVQALVAVEVQAAFDLGPVRQVSLEHFLIGIWHVAKLLAQASGIDDLGCELYFEHPKPECHADYADRLPPCHFGAPAYQLRFPAQHLAMPLKTADATAARLATAYCENEAQRQQPAGSTVTARVQAVLATRTAPPLLGDVAGELHMSPRSLKRKLRAEHTAYKTLIDRHRERLARRWLSESQPGIGCIAEDLGYTTTANFTRAFRRWTGMTPSQMRAQYRAVGGGIDRMGNVKTN